MEHTNRKSDTVVFNQSDSLLNAMTPFQSDVGIDHRTLYYMWQFQPGNIDIRVFTGDHSIYLTRFPRFSFFFTRQIYENLVYFHFLEYLLPIASTLN